MDMKDIPPEVFKWLFEQKAKGEEFSIFVIPDCIAFKDDIRPYYLDLAYQDGRLLEYLDDEGYEEKPEQEDID